MTHILLTGAGFTHNWGGWLASEIEGDLLQRLRGNGEVHARVRDAAGFEEALAALQADVAQERSGAKEQYRVLKKAILESFQEMNLALANRGTLEFSNIRRFSAKGFLARFDAIYTLNQDLLLELLYDPLLEDRLPRRSCYSPGIAGFKTQGLFADSFIGKTRRIEGLPLRIDHVAQPIYKLHGSVDWVDGSSELLVMGGGKQETIEHTPILKEYFVRFWQNLIQPGACLMIIGYGFRDAHINDLLGRAWQANHSLSAFYVDPKGRRVSHGADPELPQYTPPWGYIQCIGESTRPLSSTFAGDELELRKLERFFS
jgi:SIR2-like domain